MISTAGFSLSPRLRMPAFVVLAILANLCILPKPSLSADECFSCMTCNAGSETIFSAGFAFLGETDDVDEYTMVPSFPEAQTNCPPNSTVMAQKVSLTLTGSQCLQGYWVYKDSAGDVLLSCVAAIPLEDLFENTTEANLTAADLKAKLSMLTADGIKADLMKLTSAADDKNTDTLTASFSICSTDNCNEVPSDDSYTATVELGAHDPAKLDSKKTLLNDVCSRMVDETEGATGYDCDVIPPEDSAKRARRATGVDKGEIKILVLPGVDYTTEDIGSTYAAAITYIGQNTGDAALAAILADFATTATFVKEDDDSFSSRLLFSNLCLIVCFGFRTFL